MRQLPEDQLLIKQALTGDERAYADIVRRYQDRVASVIGKTTRRPEMVDDLTQEVFIKAFYGLAKFKRKAGFMTWLYRIAVNTSIEAIRKEESGKKLKEKIKFEIPDSIIIRNDKNGERMVLDRELQIEVHSALDKLTAENKAVLTLRYLEDFSTPEIAKIMNMPEGTVRSKLYYARLKLADLLRPVMDPVMPVKTKKRK